jgi:ribosome-dependent ATPase
MPFRAETIRGYIEGTHQKFVSELEARNLVTAAPQPVAKVETRFLYNQDFDSVYAMVPATLALMLALIPGILMALAIVREKELGSIINLYVTPVTRIEFLLGKQLPYIVLAMVNFALMFLMAVFFFGVPLKGSFFVLVLGVLLYVGATTSYGMLISAFTRTQIAALFGTAILIMLPAIQFSGMLTPVSSLAGAAVLMGRIFPMSYFLPISVGAFTKGLGFADLSTHLFKLAVFFPTFILLTLLLLRKQER